MNNSTLNAVSLFSGAGGMDVGFKSAGFNIVSANELNKNAVETYKANFDNHIIQGDIDENMPMFADLENISCVFGGPPCQGFSVAGKMDLNDSRSKLVLSFMKVVEITEPECFVMENVKALATLSKFSHFREELFNFATRLGYSCELIIANSREFGVPQSRERMFFVGFKNKKNLRLNERLLNYKKDYEITAKMALSKLGPVGSDENPSTCNAGISIAANPILRKSPYAGMIFNGMGRPIDPNKPSQTLPASMGGNKTPIVDERTFFGDGYSWIEEYHSSLRLGGAPLPMSATPSSLRRLTIEEAKILHTFPKDFIFKGPKTSIYSQIGNAVPCELAKAIALVTLDVLNDVKIESNITQDLNF